MDFSLARKLVDEALLPRRLTARRLANLLVVLGEHFVSRPARPRGRPLRLIVDPSSHCGLACPLCPTGQGRTERERGVMSLAHFEALMREAAPDLLSVDFYCWGEPLTNRALPDMIRLAARLGVATSVSSHLNIMTPELARALVESGLGRLTVSLDGASAPSYAQYRRGGDFETVLRHVRLLAQEKARRGGRGPKLVWQFLVMRHNEHELAAARGDFRRLGFDALSIRPMRGDMGRELELDEADKAGSALGFLPKDPRLSRYDAATGRRRRASKRCLFLWTQCVVHPDGAMSPCCGTYEPRHDVGNAFDAGLLAAWNGPRYRALREGVGTRSLEGDGPCARCLRDGFLEY